MKGIKVAWGCGPIPLESADQYDGIMKFRREWEMKEPFLPMTGQYFWKMLMSRLYSRVVISGLLAMEEAASSEEDFSSCDVNQGEFAF